MNKILITGGFGFLGGRIAQHLSTSGYSIVLGSRNQNSPPDWLPNSEVRQMNWMDTKQISTICDDIDVIIHCAGMNSQDCANNPIAAIEFNSIATTRLIEVTKNKKVSKFIYLSTAHVYKSPLVGLISEDTCTTNSHPYASTHLCAEKSVNYASSLGYFQGINLRLSNGFGVPTHKEVSAWNLLVNDLCKQVIKTKNLKLNSSGIQKRDFIPISSISSIIEKLILNKFNFIYPHLNIGSGFSLSVLEMSEVIQSRVDYLFGYLPKIDRPIPNNQEKEFDLTFNVDRIKDLGLYEKPDFSSEIDQLLLFCRDHFS